MTKVSRLALVAAVLICQCVVTAGPKVIKRGFFVYDQVTSEYVVGAVVTVSASGFEQSGETRRPHGLVTFWVPAEITSATVYVTAEGYFDHQGQVTFGSGRGVGSASDWIGLTPR